MKKYTLIALGAIITSIHLSALANPFLRSGNLELSFCKVDSDNSTTYIVFQHSTSYTDRATATYWHDPKSEEPIALFRDAFFKVTDTHFEIPAFGVKGDFIRNGTGITVTSPKLLAGEYGNTPCPPYQ